MMSEAEPRSPGEPQRKGHALVIMGVSGSGKSTVGELLAERLGWEMMEGDRLHPPANVEKMRQGIPLDDADREPWLDRIGEELKAWARRRPLGRADLLGSEARLPRPDPCRAARRPLRLPEGFRGADRPAG